MNKQTEFDWAKDLPQQPRMGKVRILLEYAVDLNDDAMVQNAKECLYEDLMSIMKYNEALDWIGVVENPEVSYDEIPEFLLGERDIEE